MALEPLYDSIDPDALDALIRSGGPNSAEGTTTATFAFDDYEVTVQRDGAVVMRPDPARPGLK